MTTANATPLFEAITPADLPARKVGKPREISAEDKALGTALAAALVNGPVRSTAEFADRKSAETVVRKLARLANMARGDDAAGYVRQAVAQVGTSFRWFLRVGDKPKPRAPKDATK